VHGHTHFCKGRKGSGDLPYSQLFCTPTNHRAAFGHMTADANTAVGKSVGYHSLKTEQQHRAVTAFASGRDVLIALPTGFGKSLCYSCLPRVFDCLKGTESKPVVVVVTPLLVLMED